LTEFQIEIITPLLTKDAQSRKTASQMLKRLNEGPRSLILRNKKEGKNSEGATRDSFLDQARKQDLEDKKSKQDSENKRIDQERLAKERQEAILLKNNEKEIANRLKAQERLAKKASADEAKRIKKEAKLAGKSIEAQAPSSLSVSSKKNQKILAAAVSSLLLIAGGYIFLSNSGNKTKDVVSPEIVTPTYTWSALVSGESTTQSGDGTSFELFVCDQNVIASTLKVINVSERPQSAGPLKAKVLKGDVRCGKEFDTIVVSGREAEIAGSVNYYISGKTSSQFDFRYDFSVTVLPK
jgi:hypothetical protein